MNVKDDICLKFLSDPSINPISNRKIKINDPTFNKLVKLCKELKYDDEIDELLNSLLMDEKIGLTGLVDIERIIISSYDLEVVINLLRADSRLRKLIYELIPIIIENYKNSEDQSQYDIISFINDLIEMKEFTLLNRFISELEMNNEIILNYNLDGIIEFIRLSKFNDKLYQLLIKLIPDILISYIESFEIYEPYDPYDYEQHKSFKPIIWNIETFIKKLLYFKETNFSKITIESFRTIIGDDMDYYLTYYDLSQEIFSYDKYLVSHVIVEYIKMLPEYINISSVYAYVEQTIEDNFKTLINNNLFQYIKVILNASITLKDNNLFNIINTLFNSNSNLNINSKQYEILKRNFREAVNKINMK